MSIKLRLNFLTRQKELASLYRKVFQTPEGEQVVQHLMKEAGILGGAIVKDPNLLLIQEGQRRVVLSILRMVGKDPREIQKQIEQALQQYENTNIEDGGR